MLLPPVLTLPEWQIHPGYIQKLPLAPGRSPASDHRQNHVPVLLHTPVLDRIPVLSHNRPSAHTGVLSRKLVLSDGMILVLFDPPALTGRTPSSELHRFPVLY